jgi:hypothetical protein
VRVACLNAIKHVPSLGKRVSGEDSTVATLLWMALYDPEEVNKNLILLVTFCKLVQGPGLLCFESVDEEHLYAMY